MQENKSLKEVLDRWLGGQADQLDRDALVRELNHVPDDAELAELLRQFWEETEDEKSFSEEKQEMMIASILSRFPATETYEEAPVRRMPRWIWAAASVILLALVGGGIWMISGKKDKEASIADVQPEVVPGKKGAVLTLADGSQVLLDSVENGVVALQGGVTAKVINGELHYEGVGNEVLYNTISTPKGRQFRLRLPDNTEVWLNAGSSVRYPTRFSGTERKIEISGEAYLEVAKNSTMPFHVGVNNLMDIEVLGTEFNINAYEDEKQIKTTLVGGRIRIVPGAGLPNEGDNAVILVPGQEASVQRNGKTVAAKAGVRSLKTEDLEKILAWKNGGFDFERVTLEEAMRQIERWYDIEVVIEPGVPVDAPFDGQVSRNISLNKLIKLFEKSELKFRIENANKLIVSN